MQEKLNDMEQKNLYDEYNAGNITQMELAKLYGISQSTVSNYNQKQGYKRQIAEQAAKLEQANARQKEPQSDDTEKQPKRLLYRLIDKTKQP